jgi:hypothetical protein
MDCCRKEHEGLALEELSLAYETIKLNKAVSAQKELLKGLPSIIGDGNLRISPQENGEWVFKYQWLVINKLEFQILPVRDSSFEETASKMYLQIENLIKNGDIDNYLGIVVS